MFERDKKPDFRTRTMSFKVTPYEEKLIKEEVKKRKMKYLSEFLAFCVFSNVGKQK